MYETCPMETPMTFEDINDDSLPDRIAERLRHPRTPPRISSPVASRLSYGRHRGPPGHNARPAAVTILFYPIHGRWHIPFTLRPEHLHDHGGQVSLPGGRLEDGETFVEAACRELHEEIDVAASQIEILGSLSPTYVFASNYRVDPIVACARTQPPFRPDPLEVVEIIELPVDHMLDPAHYGRHEVRRGGIRFTAPHIAFRSHRIWGATHLILGEMIAVLNDL
jgi:8-oxo-dGTP pyrophosphatase MutT (NUDIX family)